MADITPERRRTLQLQERVFRWACGVLRACPESMSHLASHETWRQLVKAAPSASHNLIEADEASSTRDFMAKMKIALREAKESRNCLRFITHCKLANHQHVGNLGDEARQISAIFASILIKVKARYKAEQEAKRQRKRKAQTT